MGLRSDSWAMFVISRMPIWSWYEGRLSFYHQAMNGYIILERSSDWVVDRGSLRQEAEMPDDIILLKLRVRRPSWWCPLNILPPNIWALFDPPKIHPRPSQIIRIWLKQKKTSPKAQRTRGLSSAYQSHLFMSYHKFKKKSWSSLSSESRRSINFKITTKHHQHLNLT